LLEDHRWFSEKQRRLPDIQSPLTVKAPSLLCYWAVRKLGSSATELSKKLGVSQPTVSISVKRGEKIPKTGQLELVEE